MDADGSNKEPLVVNPQTGSPQLGNHPAWSPDGTKLAFDRCLDCEFGGKNVEVFLADLQTGAVDTLTDHPVGDSHPTWSPDGRRIAFTSNRDYFDADSMRFRRELYMIDSDGKNLIRLTDTGKVTVPKWSPDEKYIAYSWQRLDPDIYLFDLDSKKIIKLTNLKFVGAPMWNHDSSQLLISGTTLGGKRVLQLISKDGQLLKETELDFKDLESTRNFDWYDL
jgi:Tol biopolymer transport system component